MSANTAKALIKSQQTTAAGVSGGTERHGLITPIPMPFRLPTPLYGAMLAIWHLRPVLQRRFSLEKGEPEDFLRFLAWCAIEGRRQYAILRAIPGWDDALSRPLALPVLKNDRWSGGFSVAMFCYGVARYRYFLGPMLKSARARHRIARAFWRGERHKCMLPVPQRWQLDDLRSRLGGSDGLIQTLRIKSKDEGKSTAQLIGEFGLEELQHHLMAFPSGAEQVEAAELARLPAELGRLHLRGPIWALRKLAWLRERLKRRPSQFELASITNRIQSGPPPLKHPAGTTYPFGVNLFGYAKGEIGIGEDVRLVALALEANQIPFCIVNVKPGDNVSQQESSVDHWLVDQPRYAINIFCITGIEQVRYACEKGLKVFEGRYTIGFWPWELPSWPASCTHAFSTVNEIWGISRYTANAYRSAQQPVYAMSLPVTAEPVAPLTRSDFALPEGAFLFVFSFDFNSTFARKNPEAVIEAFQRAFPRGENSPAGLVIKANHVDLRNPRWQQLARLSAADPRIHIIDTTLRRPEVLALYRCCDCFVSLHRAEGFGRGLAEALLLERQLIATAFSGNLDFCNDKRVGLVRHRPRDVGKREYFHADGQSWAAPDIDHAAELMCEIFSRAKPVISGEPDFSPATVGRRYAQRLNELKQQLNLTSEKIC